MKKTTIQINQTSPRRQNGELVSEGIDSHYLSERHSTAAKITWCTGDGRE